MKQYVPEYYNEFKCIAGACRHTCCAGWEIDIDKYTMAEWHQMDEPLRSFILDKVCFPDDCSTDVSAGNLADHSADVEAGQPVAGQPFLKLAEDDRCAFLNNEGLCEMILRCGEDTLCQICTDHPRFRNFYSDRIEMGAGLSCEAAAELIVSWQGNFRLTKTDQQLPKACLADVKEILDDLSHMTEAELQDLRQNEADVFQLRDMLIGILEDRTLDIDSRIDEVLSCCDITMPDLDTSQWADALLSLDRLDAQWTHTLEELREASFAASCTVSNGSTLSCSDTLSGEDLPSNCETQFAGSLPCGSSPSDDGELPDSGSCFASSSPAWLLDPAWQKAFENLMVYFLYRHMPESLTDFDVTTKISFAALSCRLLRDICLMHDKKYGSISLHNLAEYARMYSSEIEYSLSNLGKVYDMLF